MTMRRIRNTMSTLPGGQQDVHRHDRGQPLVVPGRGLLPRRIAQGGVEGDDEVASPRELRVPGEDVILVDTPAAPHRRRAELAPPGKREPVEALALRGEPPMTGGMTPPGGVNLGEQQVRYPLAVRLTQPPFFPPAGGFEQRVRGERVSLRDSS